MLVAQQQTKAGMLTATSGKGAVIFASRSPGLHVTFFEKDERGNITAEWEISFQNGRNEAFGIFSTNREDVQKFFRDRTAAAIAAGEVPDIEELTDNFVLSMLKPEDKVKMLMNRAKQLEERNTMLESLVKGGATGLGQAGPADSEETRARATTGQFQSKPK